MTIVPVDGVRPYPTSSPARVRSSQRLQCAFQELQPVLPPENLAGRQHLARRAEDAGFQRILRVLLVEPVKLGIR
ncbi:hypothetical protein RYA05_36015, partial [Pseudomonas syringae pv. actinidiae]|nr:hypothetical protein [Pseudomonas syringae pv. actinidiae]